MDRGLYCTPRGQQDRRHDEPACVLLAAQLRGVADDANIKKASERVGDIRAWRKVLAQFVPVVLRECRNAADIGGYDCHLSLAALLEASQLRTSFPQKGVLCCRCRKDSEPLPLTPILRGCYLNTQPDHVLDLPPDFCLDVTHFVTALHASLVPEIEKHGFTVVSSSRTFGVACAHLSLFTSAKEAPDALHISWHPEAERAPPRKPMRPVYEAVEPTEAVAVGNLTMQCGICHEDRPMQTIIPCGHLICGGCWANASSTAQCPFCRGIALNVHPLYCP